MKMKYILPMMMLAAMPMAADAQNKSGLVMSNLDKTAKPADDFYQFATGGWQTVSYTHLTLPTSCRWC